MSTCVLCGESLENGKDKVKLGKKGCDGIIKASEQRGVAVTVVCGQFVHEKCRREFTNPLIIAKDTHKEDGQHNLEQQQTPSLRSAASVFKYKDHCLFCGCPGDRRRGDYQLIPIRSMDFQIKILNACEEFKSEYADQVKGRIHFAQDLHAADASYHKLCSTNFRTGRGIPKIFVREDERPKTSGRPVKQRRLSGRPIDSANADAFVKVINFIENNYDKQITISNLIEKMSEFGARKPYAYSHMKAKLKEHFGSNIVITEGKGTQTVITLHSNATKILQDFHIKSQKPDCNEKMHIIHTAAKLIKNDIKQIEQTRDTYPSTSQMSSTDENLAYLPESLRDFLKVLIIGKDVETKIASIGQAIMQVSRPNILLAPLQVGLGIQLHSHFASRFLIDSLHAHGFCCSYSEVIKYERNAAVSQGTDFPEYFPGHFHQYVGDNVDHNSVTIDGKNTFHGMGIVAAVTPGIRYTKPVPRVQITSEDIAAVGSIDICPYTSDRGFFFSMRYEALENPHVNETYQNTDLLWKLSLPASKYKPRPLWNGYMQMVAKGNHPDKSSIMFLPLIDMDPTNLTCIYSTLRYICMHAWRYGATPIITFDQPLWWKAYTIVESEAESSLVKSAVIRLGGFHTQMSFLGCIGHLMAGSGIREVLERVYASNTVSHMLSGKAVARAVRGHLLVDAALNAILISRLFPELQCGEQEGTLTANEDNELTEHDELQGHDTSSLHPDLQAVDILMNDLLSGKITTIDVESNDVLERLCNQLSEEKTRLQDNRTSRLWLQYMCMIDTLRRFIKAERTGNWNLHLQSLFDMLPYLAAAGHNLYTKSVHIYLQKMSKLQEEKPDVYNHFINGLHVVRRSDRFWAGLSTDLIIEQVLMRSLKSTGGITRGRGMSELQRAIWVLSSPHCAEVNSAMQQFTSVHYISSEQHKEATQARMSRDAEDTSILAKFLDVRNPFNHNADQSLRSISTGVTAPDASNVDTAVDVGKKIIDSMNGKLVCEHVFRKKEQAVTMDTKSAIKVASDVVQVDPNLLFQRLVTAGARASNLRDIMCYELSTFPSALFESKFTMRSSNKASLAHALWTEGLDSPGPQDHVQYILDGGALLHRIPWAIGTRWDEIISQYCRYVSQRYRRAVIVFDGYTDGPTPKDSAHLRRTNGAIGRAVQFTGDMKLQTKKEEFLANKENKQRFIHVLGEQLERNGCQIIHAPGDADLHIVKAAVASAERCDTVLVGDDTDLLVLLCYHAKNTTYPVFFRPEQKANAKRRAKCWNITTTRYKLGDDVCDNILFIHAILGCDTTSFLYGIGKRVSLTRLRQSPFFKQLAQVFATSNAIKERIIEAGENAVVSLYNGAEGEAINDLRLRRFCDKATSSTTPVQAYSIPPTSNATKYHSLRVYYQVQSWMKEVPDLKPDEWGWDIVSGKMLPISMDIDPAPQHILEIIRCNCKSGCYNLRCTCRKNDMECTLACGECRGVCANTTCAETVSDDEN